MLAAFRTVLLLSLFVVWSIIGLIIGILSIVNGALLLKRKNDITF